MASNKLKTYKLGELIKQRREKFDGLEDLPIRGVCADGFIPPKQKDADTSLYNVFYRNDFIFNPARMEINSIALNCDFEKGICSSLYEVFYVKDESILLPKYLNLFVKRREFARQCEFIGWGSAREYCRVGDISNIDITLPDKTVQQKYVDIYEAMVANQKSYEKGLDDLKLTCDAYLDKLKKEGHKEKIGKYLKQCDLRNDNEELTLDNLRGISTEKKFIDSKADMMDVSLKNYKVVKPNQFTYVADTSRRGDKIALAFNDSEENYLVSSIYTVFKVEEELLNPLYLMMFLSQSDFDRYARFNSWGSARETFDWSEMCDVQIPIPDIEIQKSIANIYKVYTQRKAINKKLKTQIRDICPILIKGSLEA